MCNAGCIAPADGFLEGLRRLCDEHGVLLIFDEVITGFRLAMGGGAEHFGVTPDVAVYGKALASGYPLSVLAGREPFMRPVAEGRAIHAGTMNSGVSGVAAAAATLEVLARDAVHQHIWALGEQLAAGLRDAAQRTGQPLLVQGIGPVVHAGFTPLSRVNDYPRHAPLRQCQVRAVRRPDARPRHPPHRPRHLVPVRSAYRSRN